LSLRRCAAGVLVGSIYQDAHQRDHRRELLHGRGLSWAGQVPSCARSLKYSAVIVESGPTDDADKHLRFTRKSGPTLVAPHRRPSRPLAHRVTRSPRDDETARRLVRCPDAPLPSPMTQKRPHHFVCSEAAPGGAVTGLTPRQAVCESAPLPKPGSVPDRGACPRLGRELSIGRARWPRR
jgi:hypothetical protein